MDNRTREEVIRTMNKERTRRKESAEVELHGVQVDELVESAIEKGSWFRENVGLDPNTSRFWEVLPRYIQDCIKPPRHVTDTQVMLHIHQAIQKYHSLFK